MKIQDLQNQVDKLIPQIYQIKWKGLRTNLDSASIEFQSSDLKPYTENLWNELKFATTMSLEQAKEKLNIERSRIEDVLQLVIDFDFKTNEQV